MLHVALFCEHSAGAQALRMLAASPHRVVSILTSPPESGRPVVWRLAEQLGYSPTPAVEVRAPGFAQQLARLDLDLILNVHSLYIVPEAVLRVPRLGAYNLHPGPLPAFAGLNGLSWAIYQGEADYGVTLHRMEPGIDTGAIVYQEAFCIEPEDTALSVGLRCVEKGFPLVARLLEAASADPPAIPHAPQDLSRRRYFGRKGPLAGLLSWNERARRIHDLVRACDYHPFPSPWGTPRAQLAEREVEILKTCLTGEACEAAPGTVRHLQDLDRTLVATADEWLWVKRFRVPAGAPLAVTSW